MDLKGATAIVVGASGGIGRAVALRLAESGARLVLAARDASRLAAVAEELAALGAEAISFPADATHADEVGALAAEAAARFRRIDALVHAAGAFATAPITEQDEAGFDRQIAANLKSLFLVCKAVAPRMIAQRAGHIVNVLSIASRFAFPENAAYCASKWGALGLTKVLAEELRPHGVRVTAVLPGAVDTPIWDRIAWAPDRARMLRPDDVARVILGALASPPSATIDEIVLTPPGGAL
jgi:3-oxoacyl-[acyl-carrier protein] reductase